MENNPALLTFQQAADLTGIKHQTWKKWAALGRLPVPKLKINGLVRFRRADLEKLIRTGLPVRDPARRGTTTKAERVARELAKQEQGEE